MKRADQFRKTGRSGYRQLRWKLVLRLAGTAAAALALVILFYRLVWFGRGADVIVQLLQNVFYMTYDDAVRTYWLVFRNNAEIVWVAAASVIFLLLLRFLLRWFTHYFDQINQGINALLDEKAEIHLPAEMLETERKLVAVKQALRQRTMEAELAEQRKNDLVMYLAHDIRTPLTSVIGYLSLLDEAVDMPPEQRIKYIHITLDKAHRLEKLVNEFFEITRYNLQQIDLKREKIDLYYMLVQMIDEFYPILSARGNTAVLRASEDLTVTGDPAKLARVLNNVLKNAAAYSAMDTEITVSASEQEDRVTIEIANLGPDIPESQLNAIFDKFYRLDDARTSSTGGAGLGLAIAKEIVTLHGGTISARSAGGVTAFTITLLKDPFENSKFPLANS